MAKIKRINPGIRHVWVDQYGIIGQPYPGGVEGGDSACWNGHYNYFTDYDDKVDYVKTFEVAFGGYVRHPHPHEIYNKYGAYYKHVWEANLSRDQMTGVLAGIIDAKDRGAMLRLILHWIPRLFLFAYNTRKNGVDPAVAKWKLPDFTGPNMWAMALRGFGKLSYIFFPLLCIFDLQLVIDTLIANKTDKDNINYLLRMSVARDIVPTPVGKLAVKLLDKEYTRARIHEYWTGWRDNPGMYDIHSKAIDRLR